MNCKTFIWLILWSRCCYSTDYTFKYHRIDLNHPEKPCSQFGTYAAKGRLSKAVSKCLPLDLNLFDLMGTELNKEEAKIYFLHL